MVSLISIATSRPPPVSPADVPMWSIASQPLTLPCGTAEVRVSKSGKTGLGITVTISPTGSGQRRRQVAVDPATPSDPAGMPSQVAVDPATSSDPAGMPSPVAVDPATPSDPAGMPSPVAVAPAAPANAPLAPVAPACLARSITATLTFSDRSFPGRLVTQKRSSELQAELRQRRAEYVSAADLGRVPEPSRLDETYYYLAFELDNEERWNRGERTATLELAIEAGGRAQVWTMPATHAYREWPADQR